MQISREERRGPKMNLRAGSGVYWLSRAIEKSWGDEGGDGVRRVLGACCHRRRYHPGGSPGVKRLARSQKIIQQADGSVETISRPTAVPLPVPVQRPAGANAS
jgi:hypothetical protein